MLPTAFVVHRTRQRVRLRVPDKRGDPQWFDQAADSLTGLDWVQQVETGINSASLVLYCSGVGSLDEHLSQTGVFEFQLQAPARTTVTAQVRGGVDSVDSALQNSTAGGTDLRNLMFLLFLGLAGVQLVRGKVMAPAISLLWYAMDIALTTRDQPTPDD